MYARAFAPPFPLSLPPLVLVAPILFSPLMFIVSISSGNRFHLSLAPAAFFCYLLDSLGIFQKTGMSRLAQWLGSWNTNDCTGWGCRMLHKKWDNGNLVNRGHSSWVEFALNFILRYNIIANSEYWTLLVVEGVLSCNFNWCCSIVWIFVALAKNAEGNLSCKHFSSKT